MIKDCERHIEQLRNSYINANRSQRRWVAETRMQNPCLPSNILIIKVSAVEALARAIVIEQKQGKGETVQSAYEKVKHKNGIYLIQKCICPEIKKKPEDLFSKDFWEEFKCAVKYRNLLIHECTSLRAGISTKLIKTCQEVWNVLERI